EIFDLDALAEDCAKDGVREFQFVAPPLPITGAVGSPINPLAIK
ncbi:MAG TPA: cyclase family protein, partial [Candidatus Methylomirabilis sp.]|nr:cyclase family protein [Candidatus Methylomirabilis sp.]